jgi:hypothetical protein
VGKPYPGLGDGLKFDIVSQQGKSTHILKVYLPEALPTK